MQVYSGRQKLNSTPQSSATNIKKSEIDSYDVYFKACLNTINGLNQSQKYKTCYLEKEN